MNPLLFNTPRNIGEYPPRQQLGYYDVVQAWTRRYRMRQFIFGLQARLGTTWRHWMRRLHALRHVFAHPTTQLGIMHKHQRWQFSAQAYAHTHTLHHRPHWRNAFRAVRLRHATVHRRGR